jgi:ribosomal-protein-alanine N-acetyltransferase
METETAPRVADQPSLETSRLILRPLEIKDGPEVQRLAGDIRIAEMTLSVPLP